MATTTHKQNIDFAASMTFNPKDIEKLEKAFGAGFTDAISKAAKLGSKRFTDNIISKMGEVADDMKAAAAAIQAKQEQINALAEGDAKKAAEKQLRADKLKLFKQKRAFDLETKTHNAYIDRQEEMLKAYDELAVKIKVDKKALASDMGEALSGAFGKLSSGDFAGLASSLGGALSKGGGMLESAGLAAGGAEAGGMAAAMAGLGPAIAAIGATVGVIAAVAVVFQMAYDQTKKYNQALTEGAGAADFFSKGVGSMSGTLKDLRGATFELGKRFRMDTEEIAKFTNTLNSSGVTYKEFIGLAGEGKSAQEAFFDVTKTAIVAAKGLGIEAGDAAAFMDKSMRDLGKTSLVEIQGAFGMIGDAAARSGMSVKSFFTAINEATSGMALHNIRLEDTIGLMLTMTKVLGEDAAKERAKMEGTFKNMGYTERIKTVLTTGKGTTSKIVGADARAQAREMGQPLKEAISKFMPDLVGATGVSVEKLGTMTEKQYRALVTKMRASDDANAVVAARQLDNMRDLAKGAINPGDELAQADALGQLSKSGELAMQLAGASAVLGKKGISDMRGLTRAAFEQITSMSGENFEVMKRLDRELRGQFDAIQQKVKDGTATDKEKEFAKMDFTEAIASGFGKAEMEKGVRAGFTGMERMTESMLTETQSITTTLKNYVGFFLESIYGLLEWIVRKMGGDDQAEALDMQKRQMDALEEANTKSTEMVGAINELRRKQAVMGLSPAEQTDLDTKEKAYKDNEADKARLRAGVDAFSQYSDPEAAMRMSKVAGASAAVGAGGGAAALAEEKKAREEAADASDAPDRWAKVFAAGVAGAAAGGLIGAAAGTPFGGVGAVPGYAIGAIGGGIMGAGAAGYAWYSGEAEGDAQTLAGLGTSSTGIDQLAESTGLTEEYSLASKDTLAEMLSKDAGYFTSSGKPLASLAADQKTLLDKLLKSMNDTKQSEALQTLANSSEEGKAAVAAFLTSGKKDALDIDEFTKSADPAIMMALKTAKGTTSSPVDDFIYRGGASGGIITPINSADDFIGMKPGGNVERAGRGGTGGTVVVNINGDTATIVRVMKDVLQKSGLTASPNNGFA